MTETPDSTLLLARTPAAVATLPDTYLRLRSFSPTTWFGKPPQLSTLECAAKGWTNTGPDQLSCLSCGCQILCKLPLNPWSDTAAGVVQQYIKRLVDAHSPQCLLRKQLLLAPQPAVGPNSSSLGFPILPTQKLSSAFYSRLQDFKHLDVLPPVTSGTRARLAAAAAGLDSSLLSGLATLLHQTVNTLQHEAATYAVLNKATATEAGAAVSSYLPRQQAQVLLALCGWQPKLLLPPELAPAKATDQPASILGVSHLLPRRHEATSSAASGAAAAAGSAGDVAALSSSCTALECELCGSRVGLWQFTRSGPFYAQQLSSKVMQVLTAAAAAGTDASADTASRQEPPPSTAVQHTPVAGAKRTLDSSAGTTEHLSQQQQQQQQGSQPQAAAAAAAAAAAGEAEVASPEVVFSSLCSTIAGGSLLTAGASGGGAATATGTLGSSPQGAGPFGQQQQQPFGSTPQPAFGSLGSSPAAAAGGSSGGGQLFDALAGAPAASVFGSPPPVATAAASGPFGAAASGGGGADAATAAAPVFGLQAFQVEEQRAKRRRSSAAAAEFAAAAAAAAAGHHLQQQVAATPVTPGTPGPAAAAPGSAGRPPAAAARGSAGGSAGRVRSYSKQCSGLVAAVAAATGDAAVAQDVCFDPLSSHRSWCPWVREDPTQHFAGQQAEGASNSNPAGGGSGSTVGLLAAVRLGWSSTLMAVQEAIMQAELDQPLEQQQLLAGGGVEGDGGGYDSTAAVMARARQAMDLLESQ